MFDEHVTYLFIGHISEGNGFLCNQTEHKSVKMEKKRVGVKPAILSSFSSPSINGGFGVEWPESALRCHGDAISAGKCWVGVRWESHL